MGMAPTTPNADILALLEDAEAEINRHILRKEKSYASIEAIQRLKSLLDWSDKRTEELIVDGLSIGFVLGITAPVSKINTVETAEKKWRKFCQKGNTIANRAPGEKGPGRTESEITKALKILLTKIPPPAPYVYTQKHFMQDLITHNACIKDIIKPFKKDAVKITPRKAGSKEVSIRSAFTKLKALAK